MSGESARAALDAAAGLAVVAVAWSTPNRRDRTLVLAVAACWFLGALVPGLIALHRGAVALLLLATGSPGRARPVARLAGAALLVVLLSLPGLSPAAAAGLFAVLAVLLQVGAGPRASASARAGWLLAGVEAAVAVSGQLEGNWTTVASTAYLVCVPLACWLAVAPANWAGRAEAASTTLPSSDDDPFGAVGAVLRDVLRDDTLVVRPAGEAAPGDGARQRDRLVVRVRGVPWAEVRAASGVLSDPPTRQAVGSGLEQQGEHAYLLDRLHRQERDLAAARSRLLDAADQEREILGSVTTRLVVRPLDEVADLLRSWPELAKEIRGASADTQSIMGGYPPTPLGEGRLTGALRTLGSRCPLRMVRDLAPGLRAPASVEAVLYAVAAEALANALKHSGASTVLVRTRNRDQDVRVEVVDDGAGGARADGSGLHALRLRVEARGGQLTVEPATPRGTRVCGVVPLTGAAS